MAASTVTAGSRLFGRFLGRTISEAAAFSAGVAIAPVLGPVVRELRNLVNARYPFTPVSPDNAAAIVAEDVKQLPFGLTEASYSGIDETRFRALLGEVLNAPGIGELFEAYRRDLIDDAAFTHGLRKAKLEPMWDAPLKALKAQRLGPDVIARAIQRGLVADPGLLPVGPPTSAGKVPAFPVFPVDALAEARAYGIDKDRLGVEVGLVGNPASPDLAARMVFRDLIERVDFDRAIAEGNTRNEWADVLFEGFRQIVTAHDGIEGRLRGWLTDEQMYAQTARHGMSKEDTDLLFLINGRPLVHNQVFVGLIRGGVYDGPTDAIPKPFLKSLQESNLRPEWYNLVWAQRYHYPPFFQTVNLLNKGLIDEATARDWLTKQAYAPDAIDTVISAIGGGTGPKANTRVTSAQTKLLTGIEKAYVGGVLDDTQATAQMEQAGLSAATAAGVLAHWKQLKTLEATAPPA